MSDALISRNSDLKLLQDEGYEVAVLSGYLLVSNVPYVNSKKEVIFGTLASPLDLAGDSTIKPRDHVALWIGEYPCDSDGRQLTNVVNDSNRNEKIREGLVATFSFSQKPKPEGYDDYYQKMTTYVAMLEGHAQVIDPNATARTFLISLTENESVFCYMDTASSRAGITDINIKLGKDRIAIVGLGGTGGYVLDLVAKTPVREIHLFDGDSFDQHNAFRAPGAPSCDDLRTRPTKVAWFAKTYSRMRRKIIPHQQYVDERSVTDLRSMDFVFLCLDQGTPKRTIVEYLVENEIPFIDVGMGLSTQDGALDGLVRITSCTPTFRDHWKNRIPFGNADDNDYTRNIQIADMNALNAALAVVKWKKLRGFYLDAEHEHNSVFGISSNLLTNDDFLK